MQEVKVIAIGDAYVGKSDLLRLIDTGNLEEPTLGAAYITKIHNYGKGKSVKFQIWDTAGQQKYYSVPFIYYRNAQVAICVYDITKRRSFQVLKKRIEELKSKAPINILLAVVGNNIDRCDEEQVSYDEAKEYSQSIGAIFKLTSARKPEGVIELLTTIAERLELNNNKVKTDKQSIILSSNNRSRREKNRICCGKNN